MSTQFAGLTPPDSDLEVFARDTYPDNATEYSSYREYYNFVMKMCLKGRWQRLEYTILCILVHFKRNNIKTVYDYLKASPFTKSGMIASTMSSIELRYSWEQFILMREAQPSDFGFPEHVLYRLDAEQIHKCDAQFRYWQAAGDMAWRDHFVSMSPEMWFGPQGQEHQRRLSIPGFSDEI